MNCSEGDGIMTDSQKAEVMALRRQGVSYKAIAETTGISVGTIKAFCSRNGILPAGIDETEHRCLCCGKPVPQNDGRKEKKVLF
jgi:hypothetical protein